MQNFLQRTLKRLMYGVAIIGAFVFPFVGGYSRDATLFKDVQKTSGQSFGATPYVYADTPSIYVGDAGPGGGGGEGDAGDAGGEGGGGGEGGDGCGGEGG